MFLKRTIQIWECVKCYLTVQNLRMKPDYQPDGKRKRKKKKILTKHRSVSCWRIGSYKYVYNLPFYLCNCLNFKKLFFNKFHIQYISIIICCFLATKSNNIQLNFCRPQTLLLKFAFINIVLSHSLAYLISSLQFKANIKNLIILNFMIFNLIISLLLYCHQN